MQVDDRTLEREYPLSPDLLAMSHVRRSPTGREFVLAAKGAPEAVADLCHLTPDRVRAVGEQVATMAAEGLRVLGVARGVFRRLGSRGIASPLDRRSRTRNSAGTFDPSTHHRPAYTRTGRRPRTSIGGRGQWG